MTAFEFDSPPSPGANRSAPATDCPTCGGDRFVTVRLRSPDQTAAWMNEHGIRASTVSFHEEVAPCPDCNQQEVTYHTVNGPFRSMDPAAVREALRR